jgi:hypothetical protein
MLQTMNELDEVWEQMIAEASKNPQSATREGLAEFIAVKTANDAIRETSVKWLLDTMTEAADHANRKNARITIENIASHRFSSGNSTFAGSLVRFRQGVRCLTVEAGWTRTPGDGFMRGNALAVARITHFGIAKANAELHLLKFEDKPRWFTVGEEKLRISFELKDLIGHFQTFLGVI